MTRDFRQSIAALGCGALFGLGLSISGMLDPARVQGFLDLFGVWDPSLIFVLGGAVAVAMAGMALVSRMTRPVLAEEFQMPTNRKIDAKLLVGSAIFGVGWALGGFCPGPAVAALSLGYFTPVVFVAAMAGGMILHDRVLARLLP
jgi:uncharacterized membrane protein YedE/YeeE